MKPPTTYDEITRSTVPDPDSSFRPSAEQVQQARDGFRALDADEQARHDRVVAALAASGLAVERVRVEVERGTVTLRGEVADATTLARVGDLVRGLDDLGAVEDLLVVAR